MRRFAKVLFGGLLSFALCTCASPRATGGLDAVVIAELDQKVAEVIDTHFDPAIAPMLKRTRVHYVPDLHVPIVGKVDGYFNPITGAITVDPKISGSCMAHEFAHEVWFEHLSIWETVWFRIKMTNIAQNPKYSAFITHVQAGLARRHWLNDFCARSTEAYSDIFEILISEKPVVEVPDEIKAFYRGVLKERPPADHTMEEPPDAH